jgi:hypothetical protein
MNSSVYLLEYNARYFPSNFTLVSCSAYFFDPEDGGGMFLRNVGLLSTDYTALCSRRYSSTVFNCLCCLTTLSVLRLQSVGNGVILNMKQMMEWKSGRKTEVLDENLPRYHCVYHETHMTWPGIEPGEPRWEGPYNSSNQSTKIDSKVIQFCDSVPCDTNCASFLHCDPTTTIPGKLSAFPRQSFWQQHL